MLATRSPNKAGRIDTENFLAGPVRDFSAAYMAVKYLAAHIQNHPQTITGTTIDVLAGVIESNRFHKQKQVLFLYSEAAEAMVTMACQSQYTVAAPIIPRLLAMLNQARDKRLRAISQALGRLPVSFPGQADLPAGPWDAAVRTREISFDALCRTMVPATGVSLVWKGRSLSLKTNDTILGIIKFAHSRENIGELAVEAMWMDRLGHSLNQPGITLPRAFKIKGDTLFKITGPLPQGGPPFIKNSCIAFVPCTGYYDYPNQASQPLSMDRLKSIFFKNAECLGRLSRRGVFHTALIPLFHNRVQRNRRNDNGAYLWEHGGRLDQWLDSCQYPNFARSGPRDLEHLVTETSGGKLRHYIGEHLLSFILVIGSCFRNQAPHRRGRDENNRPQDTRDLFNPTQFSELVDGVCRAYFQGLVDRPCPPDLDLSPLDLIEALIAAMGRDDHMEEVLRVRDQQVMDEPAFQEFLRERGVSLDSAPWIEKGREDIVLDTGPHLGGFNQPISVPRLIEHLFRFSAFCTAHCYLAHTQGPEPA